MSAKYERILCTWLPAIAVIAMVLSWFWNGNFQFLGDFSVPSNPIQYLSRFSQSWDPNIDFGIFSLFALFPTPRVILVSFYSGIFLLTGTSLAAEIALVLTILLIGYSGMRYLWATIIHARGSPIGQAIASSFFVVNPFVTVYIQNPVQLVPYAVIPWCLAFTIKGIRGFGTLKYSFLVGLCFTVSFITFPQVAMEVITAAGVLAIFLLHLVRKRGLWLKQTTFIVSSLVITAGLNAYWLILAFANASLFSQLYNQVQASTSSLNTQNTILATPRLLGDWSLLAGYAGRLYVPYSPDYYSSVPTVIATSALPIIAFGAVMVRPLMKRNVFLAGAAIVGIILSTGSNPPFGPAYNLILSIPGSTLFRNPPRYFLSIVALAYALLIGLFVSFFVRRSERATLVRKAFGLGVVLLVILTIAFASSPMISGQITRNWYSPSMNGYAIPRYYSDASYWLSSNDSRARIFVLPHTGVYMATLWGYQGGNIYPYLFTNPIVTSSGGQYSPSTALDAINSVYDEFYANRTTDLGKVLSILDVSYILFDQSVDTQFYGLPPPQLTLSLLKNQTDVRLVRVFGQLMIFRNMENVSAISGTQNINILDGSPSSPGSVASFDRFQSGWELGPSFSNGPLPSNGSVTSEPQRLVVTIPASGQYVFAELYKNVDYSPGAKYLIIDARTTSPTSIALTINTLNQEIQLYADNPPKQALLNHYELPNETYLVYRIDEVISNVTRIRIAISNRLDTSYHGNLTAEFTSIVLANQIGDLSDMLDFVQHRGFNPLKDAVALSSILEPSLAGKLRTMNSSNSQGPNLSIKRIDSTSVMIQAETSQPFVLTYFTSFDSGFKAEVNGNRIALHFPVDGLANGWLIENTGTVNIQITFEAQTVFPIGIGITSATIGFLAGVFVLNNSGHLGIPFKSRGKSRIG